MKALVFMVISETLSSERRDQRRPRFGGKSRYAGTQEPLQARWSAQSGGLCQDVRGLAIWGLQGLATPAVLANVQIQGAGIQISTRTGTKDPKAGARLSLPLSLRKVQRGAWIPRKELKSTASELAASGNVVGSQLRWVLNCSTMKPVIGDLGQRCHLQLQANGGGHDRKLTTGS